MTTSNYEYWHDTILASAIRYGKDFFNAIEYYEPQDEDNNSDVRVYVWRAVELLCGTIADSFTVEHVAKGASALAKRNGKHSLTQEIELYVTHLGDNPPDYADGVTALQEYQNDLISRWQRRIINQLNTVVAAPLARSDDAFHSPEDFSAHLQEAVEKWNSINKKSSRIVNFEEQKTSLIEQYALIRERYVSGKSSMVIDKTGYEWLDQAMPLLPGGLGIVAGRSGMGKTSLILNLLYNLTNINILFVSLEMTSVQLQTRFLAMATHDARELSDQSSVSFAKVITGVVDDSAYSALVKASQEKNMENIFAAVLGRANGQFSADEDVSYSDEIISVVRKAVQQHGIQLVIVDHAQLLNSNESKSPVEVRKLAAEFNRLGITAIILNQLNKSEQGNIEEMTQFSLRYLTAFDAEWVVAVDADKKTQETVLKVLKLRYADNVTEGDMQRYPYDQKTGVMSKQKRNTIPSGFRRINPNRSSSHLTSANVPGYNADSTDQDDIEF